MKNRPNCDLRQVVLLRHGESVWNKENLFTGWTDVDLSDRGREEGQEAGRRLKEHGFTFDVAFTSVLNVRRTLWLVLPMLHAGMNIAGASTSPMAILPGIRQRSTIFAVQLVRSANV